MKIKKAKKTAVADEPAGLSVAPDVAARMIALDTEDLLDETSRWSDDYRQIAEAYAEVKMRLASAELAKELGRARVQLRVQQEREAAGEKAPEHLLKMYAAADPETEALGRAVVMAQFEVDKYRGWIEAMSGKKGRIDSIVFGMHDAASSPGTAKEVPDVDEEDVGRHLRALGRRAARRKGD